MRLYGNRNRMFFTEPLAGFEEVLVQILHHQVDDSTMGITDIALVAVLAAMESERRMIVRMERTERFVVAHGEPQGLSDLLYRQVLKLFNIELT